MPRQRPEGSFSVHGIGSRAFTFPSPPAQFVDELEFGVRLQSHVWSTSNDSSEVLLHRRSLITGGFKYLLVVNAKDVGNDDRVAVRGLAVPTEPLAHTVTLHRAMRLTNEVSLTPTSTVQLI